MLCISVFMFFKVSRQIFTLDRFGWQADKYITRGVMFFMFFYVSMFTYGAGKLTTCAREGILPNQAQNGLSTWLGCPQVTDTMGGGKAARGHGWHRTCQIIYLQEGVSDLIRMHIGYRRLTGTQMHSMCVGWRNFSPFHFVSFENHQ